MIIKVQLVFICERKISEYEREARVSFVYRWLDRWSTEDFLKVRIVLAVPKRREMWESWWEHYMAQAVVSLFSFDHLHNYAV